VAIESPGMRDGPIQRLVFVLYCVEVGAFLLLAPWSSVWDRTVVQIPFATLRHLALHPLLRGATSGFGLVHLVWAAHDLDLWLQRRRPQKPVSP
jgi:hypothetical protein